MRMPTGVKVVRLSVVLLAFVVGCSSAGPSATGRAEIETGTGGEQNDEERSEDGEAQAGTTHEAAAQQNVEQNPEEARQSTEIGRLSDMLPQDPLDPTPCATAYDKAVEMIEAIRASDPSSVPTAFAPRALFETECARLPRASRHCLIIDYAMAHLDECNAVLQTPEVQAFRETIRRGMLQP